MVDNRAFVTAWQQSKSTIEVAQRLGADTHWVNNRATHLRDKGVPLKSMPRQPKVSKPSPPMTTSERDELARLCLKLA